MSSSSMKKKGFTLIELLIAIAIIGILAAIAIPQFSAYKKRAYDSQAKASLHNLYLACKSYWSENTSESDCGLARATQTKYGFVQDTNINVVINTGTATAADIEGLGEEVRRRVLHETGVQLEWEIQRIGLPPAVGGVS